MTFSRIFAIIFMTQFGGEKTSVQLLDPFHWARKSFSAKHALNTLISQLGATLSANLGTFLWVRSKSVASWSLFLLEIFFSFNISIRKIFSISGPIFRVTEHCHRIVKKMWIGQAFVPSTASWKPCMLPLWDWNLSSRKVPWNTRPCLGMVCLDLRRRFVNAYFFVWRKPLAGPVIGFFLTEGCLETWFWSGVCMVIAVCVVITNQASHQHRTRLVNVSFERRVHFRCL